MVTKRVPHRPLISIRNYHSEIAFIDIEPTPAFILRRGPEWEATSLCHFEKIERASNSLPEGMDIDYPATYEVAMSWVYESFHHIAKHHGSQAEWLPESGLLLTYDAREISRDFPYKEWLNAAVNDIIYDWVLGYFWPIYKVQTASR